MVQLLDVRPDLKRTIVPRLGELHVIMAALRALGASIENSGIDDFFLIIIPTYMHVHKKRSIAISQYEHDESE